VDKPKRRCGHTGNHTATACLECRPFFLVFCFDRGFSPNCQPEHGAELAKAEIVMSTLEEQLKREIEEHGENSPVAQILRNQIRAKNAGRSFKSLYLEKKSDAELLICTET
jgi:glycerol dehydrogenase-like iron-containing ADH family enzyme